MLKKSFLFGIVLLLIAAGCASPAASNTTAPVPTAMLESSPTPGESMGMATETADAMLHEATPTGDMMMAGTATPEAMMTEAMPNTGEMMGTSTPQMMSTETGMMTEGTPTEMMAQHEWLKSSLVDVSSGKAFTLSNFSGKTVLVELMSTSCAACLQQQKSIQTLLMGGMVDFVPVSLDFAPQETEAVLKEHVAMNHFSWSFVQAPSDLIAQIGQEFGSQFIDPANVPLLVIDSMGTVHALPLHLTSQDAIESALTNSSH